jgi:hypothetical protein
MSANIDGKNRRLVLVLAAVWLVLFGFTWAFVTWLHRN